MSPKEMIKQVVVEKIFDKAIEDFGEKNKRNILVVKEFDGRAEVICSSSIARKLEKRPEFVKELQKLLEDDTETTDDDDYNLVSNKRLHLPKLSIPFKDTKRGWNIEVARENATLYLNILGYGIGGSKSLVTRKNKTSEKPEWWDDANNFDKFTHPSKSKLNVNEDVIASILKYHGYDPETHCLTPPIKENIRQNKSKKKRLGDSILEEDPAIVDIGEVNVDIDNNRDDVASTNREDVEDYSSNSTDPEDIEKDEASCSKQKNHRKCKKKSFVEESDEEVPLKKAKSKCQNLINPKLSWFEENVIQKNIRERRELEKKLGIDKLADELRKTSKDYDQNLDLVYSSDE